jgi:Fe2+ or Zn2+ uptake regulation protein
VSYVDIVNEDQRLAILQVLEQDPDYSHNDRVLQRALQAIGHGISTDRVRTEAHWLGEQGLVTVQQVGEMLIVKLTPRGEDAALGRARVPGVARPRPGV